MAGPSPRAPAASRRRQPRESAMSSASSILCGTEFEERSRESTEEEQRGDEQPDAGEVAVGAAAEAAAAAGCGSAGAGGHVGRAARGRVRAAERRVAGVDGARILIVAASAGGAGLGAAQRERAGVARRAGRPSRPRRRCRLRTAYKTSRPLRRRSCPRGTRCRSPRSSRWRNVPARTRCTSLDRPRTRCPRCTRGSSSSRP